MLEKIVLVDICGTLYDSNTTFDFLDFHFKGKFNYKCFRKISKTYLWRLGNKISFQFFSLDLTRIIAIKWLRGFSKEQLKKMSVVFYDDFLADRIQKEVIDEIDILRSEQTRILLVSATLDFIAETVSERMQIPEYYSTKLYYTQKGVCEGKIDVDLLSVKNSYLIENNICPPYYWTITDNLSDIDLIKNSLNSTIVVPSKYKTKWDYLINKYDIKNFKIICF